MGDVTLEFRFRTSSLSIRWVELTWPLWIVWFLLSLYPVFLDWVYPSNWVVFGFEFYLSRSIPTPSIKSLGNPPPIPMQVRNPVSTSDPRRLLTNSSNCHWLLYTSCIPSSILSLSPTRRIVIGYYTSSCIPSLLSLGQRKDDACNSALLSASLLDSGAQQPHLFFAPSTLLSGQALTLSRPSLLDTAALHWVLMDCT